MKFYILFVKRIPIKSISARKREYLEEKENFEKLSRKRKERIYLMMDSALFVSKAA